MITTQWIFILLSIVSSTAFAVEGNFSYNGDTALLSSVRYETVYPHSPSGKARIAELQALHYSCSAKLQFTQCKKSFALTALPEEMTSIKPSVSKVIFGSLQSMSLISEGEDIAFYEATQDIIVDGKIYSTAQYLETPDLVKVTVGKPSAEDYHSFVINTDSISTLESFTRTESKWAYTRYHIEFRLNKESAIF